MINEMNIELENKGLYFIRYTSIDIAKQTLFFVHGLGDSGIAFLEAFERDRFENYNVVVPDLLGYGRSSLAKDGKYTLNHQSKRLLSLIRKLKLKDIILFGHSLGGDLGTLMCHHDKDKLIKAFVNVEGNITPYDRFLSSQVEKAARGNNFNVWFRDKFMNEIVLREWGKKWTSCLRYYSSLWFCRPFAFEENARDIYKRNERHKNCEASEIGYMFLSLELPKLYCWGEESLSIESKFFISDVRHKIPNFKFEGSFHWPMIDRSVQFYNILSIFCSENTNNKKNL